MVAKVWRFAVLAAGVLGATLVSAGPASAAAPSNDDFADGIALAGPAGYVEGSTVEATSESGEPCTYGCGASVWYTWTAPTSGDEIVTFGLCASSFDTTIEAYTGEAVDALTDVTRNDEGCGGESQSNITFAPTPEVTYRIRVSGFGAATGTYRLDYPEGVPLVADTDGDGLPDDEDPDTIGAVVADSSTRIAAGNRKAFLGRLDLVETYIVADDTSSALTELGALRKRVDGCGTKADKNDWVTDCSDQLAIRSLIDDLTATLGT